MPATRKRKPSGESMFGINDCHKPLPNHKRSYLYRNLKQRFARRTARKRNSRFPSIILFPHDLGQTKHGVEKAPDYLKRFIRRRNHRVYRVADTGNFFHNIRALYQKNHAIRGNRINIGGDHSMAIATIADTLNRYPDAKVIYFDAHADINTYQSSKSKHYHGMPLSFVTGLDHDKRFSFIHHLLPYDNLLYIGGRCWDIFERNLVYRENIKHIDPQELNNDFDNAWNKILAFAEGGKVPIHVSFDVDCMDKSLVPATGTAVKGGIELDTGKRILRLLKDYTNVVNMDITELNMELGTPAEIRLSADNTVELFRPFFQ